VSDMIYAAKEVVKSLDPNMLAVLLLTVILNGLFFYTYIQLAIDRHVEFMAALKSCPSYPTPIPTQRN
jgi:hypothetical protein